MAAPSVDFLPPGFFERANNTTFSRLHATSLAPGPVRAGRPRPKHRHGGAMGLGQPSAKRPFGAPSASAPGSVVETIRVRWRKCHTGALVQAWVQRSPQGPGSLLCALSVGTRTAPPAGSVLATAEIARSIVVGAMGDDDIVAAAQCPAAAMTITRAAAVLQHGANEQAAVEARAALIAPDGGAGAGVWDGQWVLTVVSRVAPALVFVVVDETAGGATEYYRAGVCSHCDDAGLEFADGLGLSPPKAAVFLLRSTGDSGVPHFDAMALTELWVPGRGFVGVAELHQSTGGVLPQGVGLLSFAQAIPDAADLFPFALDRTADPGALRASIAVARPPRSGRFDAAVAVRGWGNQGVSPRGDVLVCQGPDQGRPFVVTQLAHRAVTGLVGSGWRAVPACAVRETLGLMLDMHPTDAELLLLDSLGPVDFYRIPELRRRFDGSSKASAWLARASITHTPWIMGLGILAAALRVLPGSVALIVDAASGRTRAVCGHNPGSERCTAHPESVFCFVERGDGSGASELVLIPANQAGGVPVLARTAQDKDRWGFGWLVLHRDCVALLGAGPRPPAERGYAALPESATEIAAALGPDGHDPNIVAHCVADTARLVSASSGMNE